MSKLITIEEAVSHIKDGMTIMYGGFLGCGSAVKLIEAIAQKGVKDLTLIGNDTAYQNKAIGMLIANKQVKKLREDPRHRVLPARHSGRAYPLRRRRPRRRAHQDRPRHRRG